MTNKRWISRDDLNILLCTILFTSLGALVGLSLWGILGKSLALPFNPHLGAWIGATFGLIIGLSFKGNNKKQNIKFKKIKDKGFKFRYLIFYTFLGAMSGVGAILMAVAITRGQPIDLRQILLQIPVGIIGSIISYRENKKRNNPKQNNDGKCDDTEPDTDPLPLPNNPKPFNPPPFESLRELEEGNYMTMGRELLANHNGSKTQTIPARSSPKFIPYQVRAMVNGDEKLAVRLYEGAANRHKGKDEQWLWEKVESDLERDRR
ncbi:MAG: hypothetical protein DCE90_05840 [Pseudanabaena sp.]|nr:MAG: hypothetical protein DCE90_05840 [Pseudanabaena sp.]